MQLLPFPLEREAGQLSVRPATLIETEGWMMSAQPYVELVTKENCPLCESGAETLQRATAKHNIAIREIDIHSDDDIYDLYATRVPVVLAPNGSVIDEGKLSQAKLTPALLRLKVSG